MYTRTNHINEDLALHCPFARLEDSLMLVIRYYSQKESQTHAELLHITGNDIASSHKSYRKAGVFSSKASVELPLGHCMAKNPALMLI